MTGNREYKSDVFSMLMEDKRNAMDLYNAINGSDYKDCEMVEIRRLNKGISLTVRNDASFILDSNLSIYEHQSTVCPNMPLRNLIYVSSLIEGIVNKRNIFGRTLIKLPTPKFAVFYNGEEEQPEKVEMKLSDSFEHHVDEPQLELKCTVYNINHGKNKEILESCKALKEYMIFVDYVRLYNREMEYTNLEQAIEQAIDRCIAENVLREFLMENRSEVLKVTQLDYTFERQLMLEREEALSEGKAQGISQGIVEGRMQEKDKIILTMYHKGYTIQQISDVTEKSIKEIEKLIEMNS